jgi:hypothetical protein
MYKRSIEHLETLAKSGQLANLQREGVERAIYDLKHAQNAYETFCRESRAHHKFRYVTIMQMWSNVPLHKRVMIEGTEEEAISSGREMIEQFIKHQSDGTQYEISKLEQTVHGAEITITFNMKPVEPQ